jgi:hypothetical protein
MIDQKLSTLLTYIHIPSHQFYTWIHIIVYYPGLYPGVEYRIKAITVANKPVASLMDIDANRGVTEDDVELVVRPAYKLIPGKIALC